MSFCTRVGSYLTSWCCKKEIGNTDPSNSNNAASRCKTAAYSALSALTDELERIKRDQTTLADKKKLLEKHIKLLEKAVKSDQYNSDAVDLLERFLKKPDSSRAKGLPQLRQRLFSPRSRQSAVPAITAAAGPKPVDPALTALVDFVTQQLLLLKHGGEDTNCISVKWHTHKHEYLDQLFKALKKQGLDDATLGLIEANLPEDLKQELGIG